MCDLTALLEWFVIYLKKIGMVVVQCKQVDRTCLSRDESMMNQRPLGSFIVTRYSVVIEMKRWLICMLFI